MAESLSDNGLTRRPAFPQKAERIWPGAVIVGLIAAAVILFQLPSEPHFVDESAYYSQSYYARLFVTGDWNDPSWLTYPAYDLPPLPKYLIGASLWLSGQRAPSPAEARHWYQDTSSRFDHSRGGLTVARAPIMVCGAIGCVAVYGLGVLTAGRSVGLLAALFVMANPLYRMLSRRAMSDVPCESLLNVGLFFLLWSWKRTLSGTLGGPVRLGVPAAGIAAGLSMLSKMSGILYFPVAIVWACLAILSPVPVGRKWSFALVVSMSALIAGGAFVALDPFLTAHPAGPLPAPLASIRNLSMWERAHLMFALRLKVSTDQQNMFPHNAVRTPFEKLSTVAVQGFGRFGVLGPRHSDSTQRFDLAQDWGAALWLPWVVYGAFRAWRLGAAQNSAGVPPTCWAALALFAVSFSVVTAYLPMAWDRYFLPLQVPAALLAAIAASRARGRFAGTNQALTPPGNKS